MKEYQSIRSIHSFKVVQLQNEIKNLREASEPLSLHYPSGYSNTTRSKSYKNSKRVLSFDGMDQVIEIDPDQRVAFVQPRVTMEKLVHQTLKYGLIPHVVPEFKGITVGGAIMGGAAESSSHLWGGFNDICSSFEILSGDGSLIQLTPEKNADLYYGISGSYGSLGALVQAEVRLVPAKPFVHLRYHRFVDPLEAIAFLKKTYREHQAEFLDGIVFSKDLAVVIVGRMQSETQNLPQFSTKPLSSAWYYQHVQQIAKLHSNYQEIMPLQDYLFRYDQGAFWMGAYLFRLPILTRFITQGLLKWWRPSEPRFSEKEVQKFYQLQEPHAFGRTIFHPLLTSQNLWKYLHKAESWIQDRMILQDFCIPEKNAETFLSQVIKDPSTFPLWLCPIKGTKDPQIFAPHLIPEKESFTHFINIGVYGMPSYSTTIAQITKQLEQAADALGGRKALYSRSYYTPEEFWKIYSHQTYKQLREKTHADGIWHDITEKVLSQ